MSEQETEVQSEETGSEDYLSRLEKILDGNEVESTPEPIEATPDPTPTPAPVASLDDLMVKVKINGEEKEIPLAELKNGYQRQSDYTNKTQELSKERQEVEAQKTQYINSIPVLANVAQQNIAEVTTRLQSQEFAQLAATDPAEYIAQKAALEKVYYENANSLQTMQQQLQLHQQEVAQKQQQDLQSRIAHTHEVLTKELGPEWTDGTILKGAWEYGTKHGFSEAELNNVIADPNVIKTLHKARLYDEMMANKDVSKQKVNKIPPKVISPTNQTNADQSFQDRKKAAFKSGKDADMVNLLASLL